VPKFVVLLVAAVVVVATAQDSVSVPQLVGLDTYQAYRALRRLGLVARFEQVSVDTAAAALFRVTGQSSDSGRPAKAGDTVLLQFNCPGMLRYWNPSVVPLLGDVANTLSFYRVSTPPRPLKVVAATYPQELKVYTFSGEADIEALVDFDGAVLAARVVKSSGYESADSAGCEAALAASFTGAEHQGQPVRVWFPLPFHWKYKEDKGLPSPVKQGTELQEPR
jgi:TonB family protein